MSGTGKLPGIYVEIKGDYSELQQKLKQAKAFATDQATGISNALNNALSPTVVRNSLDRLVKQFSSLQQARGVASSTFKSVGVDLGELRKITGLTEKQLERLQSRLLQTKVSGAQENALKRIATSAGLARDEIKELGQQFGLSEAQIEKVAYSVHGAEKKVRTLAEAIRSIPPLQRYISLPEAATSSLDAKMFSGVDQFAKELVSITGASQAAHQSFEVIERDLDELSLKTGLTVSQLQELKSKAASVAAEKTQEQALKAVAVAAGLTREEIGTLGKTMGVQAEGVERVADALHGAEVKALSFADRIAALPKIKLHTEMVQPAAFGFEQGLQGEASQFAGNLIAVSDAANVARNSFALTEAELETLRSKAGLTSEQFIQLKDRISTSVADTAQVNAFKALAQGAEMSRQEIKEFGQEMGLSVEQIDKVATALHGAEDRATAFAKRVANLPKFDTYVDPIAPAEVSLSRGMQGGEQGLVRNLVAIAGASDAAKASFALTKEELTELGSRVGLTANELDALQGRIASIASEKVRFDSFKTLADTAGLAREEVVALAKQMGFSNERAEQAAVAIHGAEAVVKSYADQIRNLPNIPTLTNLSGGAQGQLFQGYSGQYATMAEDLTALRSAERLAGKAADAFANDLDELAKHIDFTDDEMRQLQARMSKTSMVRTQENALKRLATQLELTEREMRQLGKDFDLPIESIERAADSLYRVADTGKKKMDLFSGSIAMAAGKFLLLEQAAYSAQRIVNATVFDFNATVETATLGISAAFLNNGQYIDDITGKVLTGEQAMVAAMDDADDVIQRLRASNLETIATLDQLIKAYQEAAPVALTKGFNKDQVEQFTVAMMQAAGAVDTTGMLIGQMGEEMRSLLNGGINPKNTRIATALGITNKDIKQFEGDVQGLFDFLMSKLSAYQAFGARLQKTWTGVASNTVDVLKQLSAQTTEPLFEAIRDGLYDWQQGIASINEETRELEWNAEYMAGVEAVQDKIEGFIEFIRQNKDVLGAMFELTLEQASGTLNVLTQVLGIVGNIATTARNAAQEIKDLIGITGDLPVPTDLPGAIGLGLEHLNEALSGINEEWGDKTFTVTFEGLRDGSFEMDYLSEKLKRLKLELKTSKNSVAKLLTSARDASEIEADIEDTKKRQKELAAEMSDDRSSQLKELRQQYKDLQQELVYSQDEVMSQVAIGIRDPETVKTDIAEVKQQIIDLGGELKNLDEIQSGSATYKPNKKEVVDEEWIKGHEELVKYLRTEEQQLEALYEKRKKFASSPAEKELLDAKYKEELALLRVKAQRKASTAATKAERAGLKRLSAEIRNYTNDARAAAKVGEEWTQSAQKSVQSMQRLNDQVAEAGMGEFGQIVYSMARDIQEGGAEIDAFNARLGEAKSELEATRAAYEQTGQKIIELRGRLAKNKGQGEAEGGGFTVEDANKLQSLISQYERLGSVLGDQAEVYRQLAEIKANSRVTTSDQYEEDRAAQAKYDALLVAYNEIGLVSEETFRLMIAHEEAEKFNFIQATQDKELAHRLFTQRVIALEKERAEKVAEDKFNKTGDATGLVEVGWSSAKDDTQEELIDFYKDALPDALDESADAMSQLFRDVAQGNASLSESWEALGDTISDVVFDILQDMTKMYLKMVMMSAIQSMFSGSGAGLFGGGQTKVQYGVTGGQTLGSFHGGGTIGTDSPTFYRTIPTPDLSKVPKHHTGLMSDEFLSILKNGESVLTEGQMAAIGKGLQANGSSGKSPQVNMTVVEAPGVKAETETRTNNDGSLDVMVKMVESKISDRMGRGQGLHKTMGSLYGARRKF
ncbi:hypothetical protein JWJ90_13555 [Desulfobulbus rhabdoformis]|uniref:hypothetical protein n=1 Tax=Desulfobulbus rhabdoformis TaxID=34032 RepID=UPI00196674C2|nr:hypothetical protein [Desulfobulbus rhabdoformis]MBM9615305.1 hypothetical protein [Desulfobulbus rhabdoformis]